LVDGVDPGLLAGVPPEAIEVLGEETCLAIATTVEAIKHLEDLAGTPNPFEADSPSNISLGAFKPEHAALIANYQPGSEALKNLGHRKIFKLPTKITGKIPDLHDRILEMRDYAEPRVKEFEDSVSTARESEDGTTDVDNAIDNFNDLFKKMHDASDELPTKSAIQIVENVYLLAIEGYKYRSSYMHNSRMGQHLGRPPKPTTEIIALLQDMLKGFKGELSSVNALRKQGTSAYGSLIDLIRAEQINQAVSLVSDIGEAKRQLAEIGEQDGQLDTAFRVERYVVEQAEVIALPFEGADPRLLKNRLTINDVERAKEPVVARGIEQKEISQKRELIGRNILSGITQAKNILRGGGRLNPTEEQDEEYVKRKANSLFGLVDGNQQKLFEREESGVIMAIITDHFAAFSDVVEKVKLHTSNGNMQAFPAERMDAVREIKGFDLDKTLRKIQYIMQDPNLRLYLERALDLQEVEKLKRILEQALEPQTS
jgi:hypothetical protein